MTRAASQCLSYPPRMHTLSKCLFRHNGHDVVHVAMPSDTGWLGNEVTLWKETTLRGFLTRWL